MEVSDCTDAASCFVPTFNVQSGQTPPSCAAESARDLPATGRFDAALRPSETSDGIDVRQQSGVDLNVRVSPERQAAGRQCTFQPRGQRQAQNDLSKLPLLAHHSAWSSCLGEGIGAFLASTAWLAAALSCMTLLALPFWVLTIKTAGFFGRYSTQLADVRESGSSIPYMQPYSFHERMRASLSTVLAALSFGSILEDTDVRDLVSRMRFSSGYLGRDWFLLGAHLIRGCALWPTLVLWHSSSGTNNACMNAL